MSQTNLMYGTTRKVRRRPAKVVSKDDICHLKSSQNALPANKQQGRNSRGANVPSHWSPMPSSMQYQLVPLAPLSDEFTEVEERFRKSIGRTVLIISIKRVQNPFLWEKYQRKKNNMSVAKTGRTKRSDVNEINEMRLFHGSDPDIVEAICKQNFDWRLHEKNATKYGEGSHFALSSSYSDNYAKEDINGSKFMFVAKVLVGSYTTGYSGARRPPLKNPSDPASDLYDSCVDWFSFPTIFVVFNTDQFYPEYIIEYSTVSQTIQDGNYSDFQQPAATVPAPERQRRSQKAAAAAALPRNVLTQSSSVTTRHHTPTCSSVLGTSAYSSGSSGTPYTVTSTASYSSPVSGASAIPGVSSRYASSTSSIPTSVSYHNTASPSSESIAVTVAVAPQPAFQTQSSSSTTSEHTPKTSSSILGTSAYSNGSSATPDSGTPTASYSSLVSGTSAFDGVSRSRYASSTSSISTSAPYHNTASTSTTLTAVAAAAAAPPRAFQTQSSSSTRINHNLTSSSVLGTSADSSRSSATDGYSSASSARSYSASSTSTLYTGTSPACYSSPVSGASAFPSVSNRHASLSSSTPTSVPYPNTGSPSPASTAVAVAEVATPPAFQTPSISSTTSHQTPTKSLRGLGTSAYSSGSSGTPYTGTSTACYSSLVSEASAFAGVSSRYAFSTLSTPTSVPYHSTASPSSAITAEAEAAAVPPRAVRTQSSSLTTRHHTPTSSSALGISAFSSESSATGSYSSASTVRYNNASSTSTPYSCTSTASYSFHVPCTPAFSGVSNRYPTGVLYHSTANPSTASPSTVPAAVAAEATVVAPPRAARCQHHMPSRSLSPPSSPLYKAKIPKRSSKNKCKCLIM